MICGIDEAGRGPLAGPVVIAGVIFKNHSFIEGVTDSKKLSPKKRNYFFDLIIEKSFNYHIEIIENQIIDQKNILAATMLGMQKCIEKLNSTKIKFLIDGNYLKFENNEHLKYNYQTIIKGDELIFEISAASILAKVTRDRIMEFYSEIYTGYNFKKNKGYATKEHISAIKNIGLTKIHRKSFCRKFLI